METEAALSRNGQFQAAALISLSKFCRQGGINPITAWRWRKKGWLETVNIAGRQYLTAEGIERFQQRAAAGEFSQVHKTPTVKGGGK